MYYSFSFLLFPDSLEDFDDDDFDDDFFDDEDDLTEWDDEDEELEVKAVEPQEEA